jgi:hypothetical protein
MSKRQGNKSWQECEEKETLAHCFWECAAIMENGSLKVK